MTIYINNKYTKIYYSIIDRAKLENRKRSYNVIYENHHIIPKSCGGSDDKSNLILLTPKEHYICHRLLPKMVANKNHYEKMMYALWAFINGSGSNPHQRHTLNGKSYQKIREELSSIRSNRMKLDNPYQRKEVKVKIKNIHLERYGVENVFQSEEIKDKIKQTNLERYGVDHYMKTDEGRIAYSETCIERYGVEHYSSTDEYKEKYKDTCSLRYGVENVFQSEEIKDKIKQTNLERYGVDHHAKSDEGRKKLSEMNKQKLSRGNVKLLRELKEKHKLILGAGWNMKSDEWIDNKILEISELLS